MKNKFLAFLLSISLFSPLMAENLNIQSSEISIDKKSRLTIFKGDVVATDLKKIYLNRITQSIKKILNF